MSNEINKYVKTPKGPQKRVQKVTSVNIDRAQSKTLEAENLNLSLLIRDFLEVFLSENFGDTYKKYKAKSEAENEL